MLYSAVLEAYKGIKLLKLGEKACLHNTWNHVDFLLHLRWIDSLLKVQVYKYVAVVSDDRSHFLYSHADFWNCPQSLHSLGSGHTGFPYDLNRHLETRADSFDQLVACCKDSVMV